MNSKSYKTVVVRRLFMLSILLVIAAFFAGSAIAGSPWEKGDPAGTGPKPPGPPPTACPIQFSDVPPGSTFYDPVRCLACRGILNGFSDGTFRPNNTMSRGELAKAVSNAAGFADPAIGQAFEDVPPLSTYYDYAQRMYDHGIMTGFPCGGPGEPCVPPNRPYFRPSANVPRRQTAKIIAIAAGLPTPPQGQHTFADVAVGSTFWEWIEALASAGVVKGTPCGRPGEPCDAQNRPYFRPGDNINRGRATKLVSGVFFPGCVTP
jgi:hypothetical protein